MKEKSKITIESTCSSKRIGTYVSFTEITLIFSYKLNSVQEQLT